MTSGNPSIIFSLWAAYIEPTLFELDIFYKHLVLGKRKDEALRLAKLKYLEKIDDPVFTHPKYWTSLVVLGNQEALFRGYLVKVCLLSLLPISILFLLIVIIRKKVKKKLTKK